MSSLDASNEENTEEDIKDEEEQDIEEENTEDIEDDEDDEEEDLDSELNDLPKFSIKSSALETDKDKDKDKDKEVETENISDLEKEFAENKCAVPENYYSPKCKKILVKKETAEREYLTSNPDENEYLYPSLNDPLFNVKIAHKKEFSDTKYDGQIVDIKEQAELLSKAEFELSPHQAFVKNFMSFQTPYNSLLLYHGLGSGKTCSAIGVSEEMRDYLKQMGITSKRIIIVASPNVQDNFKLQLFDERKLKLVDGLWNIRACTGNKLLKEINPTNVKGLSKEKLVAQIKNLIRASYLFLGYVEFANYIAKV